MKLIPSLVLFGCVMQAFLRLMLPDGGVELTFILRNTSIMLLCCFDYCLSVRRYFKYI